MSSGFQRANWEEETGELLRAPQFLGIWMNRMKPPSSEGWKQRRTSARGADRLRLRKGNGPEKGDLCLPPNLGLMTLFPAPLPGRPDGHGAMGGGRLSRFMNDP